MLSTFLCYLHLEEYPAIVFVLTVNLKADMAVLDFINCLTKLTIKHNRNNIDAFITGYVLRVFGSDNKLSIRLFR